jgi:hypothetical protein
VAQMTPAEAIHQLEVVIEFGELASQNAPGGHPVFEAIETARQWLSWLQEYGPAAAPILSPGSRIYTDITQAIEAVHAAVATLRDDGSGSTAWPALKALPWPWIAGGVAALVLAMVVARRPA